MRLLKVVPRGAVAGSVMRKDPDGVLSRDAGSEDCMTRKPAKVDGPTWGAERAVAVDFAAAAETEDGTGRG